VSRGAEADRARLEAILESSSSIIVALDTRYHLTDLNGAARRILGLTSAQRATWSPSSPTGRSSSGSS
jgi:PAS domain-containing protein